MSDDSMDVIQGTLEVMILRALAGEPMHGYGIAQWLRRRTDGELQVQDAAMYQGLRRLERKGWVSAEWSITENSRRARYYELTPAGRERLRDETASWRRYAAAVARVLEPGTGEAG